VAPLSDAFRGWREEHADPRLTKPGYLGTLLCHSPSGPPGFHHKCKLASPACRLEVPLFRPSLTGYRLWAGLQDLFGVGRSLRDAASLAADMGDTLRREITILCCSRSYPTRDEVFCYYSYKSCSDPSPR
jgi:hypothetical protein